MRNCKCNKPSCIKVDGKYYCRTCFDKEYPEQVNKGIWAVMENITGKQMNDLLSHNKPIYGCTNAIK